MSSNTYLIDVFNRHSVYIQRLGTSEFKRVEKYIKKAISDARGKLALASTEYNTTRYFQVIRGLEQQLEQIYTEMAEDISINLDRFAIYESDFTAKALNSAIAGNVSVALPDTQVIVQAALNKPLKLKSKQHNIQDLIREYTKSKQRQIIDEINLGLSMSETLEQLNTRITGVENMSKRQARTLTRTLTNHVMTEARNTTYEANTDILEGFRVVATLDSKTSLICGAKDGKVYDWSAPKPPFHFNCRSTIAPVVKQQYSKSIEGYRTSKGSEGKEKVGAKTTYGAWLKRQSADYQKDVLGQQRYELFRDGKLKIEDFIDENDNILTLEQLMAKDQLTLDL